MLLNNVFFLLYLGLAFVPPHNFMIGVFCIVFYTPRVQHGCVLILCTYIK